MFQITTNPATYGRKWTSPLWWTPDGVVGCLRADEATKFETVEEATEAFLAIPERTRAFYSLSVQLIRPASRAPRGNGWMKGHPGYDLA